MDKNYDVITFISRNFIFNKAEVVFFGDIIKLVTMLVKKILKTQEKLEELEIMYLSEIYICIC